METRERERIKETTRGGSRLSQFRSSEFCYYPEDAISAPYTPQIGFFQNLTASQVQTNQNL